MKRLARIGGYRWAAVSTIVLVEFLPAFQGLLAFDLFQYFLEIGLGFPGHFFTAMFICLIKTGDSPDPDRFGNIGCCGSEIRSQAVFLVCRQQAV